MSKRQGLSREETNRIQGLIKYLEDQNESLDFLQPLDYKGLGLDDYPLIIKKPMDLSTVKKNLKNSRYNSTEEVFEDLMLIWDNCRTYNMSDFPVYHHADSMERHMIKYCNMHGITMEIPAKRLRSDVVISDYQQRLDFSENLKKLLPKKIAEIVEIIQKSSPAAITNLSEGKLQIKINALDAETFSNVLQ
jgi:Bromodomain/Bromodomain extra-terminal - transcription regulation